MLAVRLHPSLGWVGGWARPSRREIEGGRRATRISGRTTERCVILREPTAALSEQAVVAPSRLANQPTDQSHRASPPLPMACEPGCSACGFNWYTFTWNQGNPTKHWDGPCSCCNTTTTQQETCKRVCVHGLPLSLDALGRLHGTDKVRHGFTKVYEQSFAPHRNSVRELLEVGVFLGGSLLMWRDYFAHANVTGIDMFGGAALFGRAGHMVVAKDHPARRAHGIRSPADVFARWRAGSLGPRLRLLEANQSDLSSMVHVAQQLESEIEPRGPSRAFDVIVDDGSHLHRDQQISLGLLFPLLRPGGTFVVEDSHTSFHHEYDEPALPSILPNRTRFQALLTHSHTTYAVLQRLELSLNGGQAPRLDSPHLTREAASYIESWTRSVRCRVPNKRNYKTDMTCLIEKREKPRHQYQ